MTNEQLLLHKEAIQLKDHELYLSRIKQMTHDALGARVLLDAFDKKELQEINPALTSIFLISMFQDLVFFADDEVIEQFRSLGCKQKVLDRCVPLLRITDQLDYLAEDPSFIFYKEKALSYVQAYVYSKCSFELRTMFMRELREFYQDGSLQYESFIRNIRRQRDYHGGTPRKEKDPFKQKIHSLIDEINRRCGNKEAADVIVKKISSGKTESLYIKKIAHSSVPRMHSYDYYGRFFTLFRLIAPDVHHNTEEEILNSKKYYGKPYKWYKAKWVTNLWRQVSSDSGSNKDF